MSKLLINEPPLQVLPSLALKVGLNEAIVLQQIHYLLLDPAHGRKIAEYRWIFNTVEQWVVNYFPFWSPKTLKRIFTRLSKLGLIITCQPEGRISRRKYYRIDMQKLEEISEGDKLAPSKGPEWPDGKGTKVALPITKTSAKTSSQRKVRAVLANGCVDNFAPRFRYPTTEDEMIVTLAMHGIEYNSDYDGDFFTTMQRSHWTIRGQRVFDWIATYKARLEVTSPSGF